MAPLPGRGVFKSFALTRSSASLCSWCGGPFNGGNYRHCTSVSFGDEFVRNLGPISNDETPDFSYPPPQPQTSSLNQFHCFHCKDPLEDGVRCQRCTCKWCGYALREGSCWICPSRDENSSIDAPNSFNDLPNVFTHPPQPQYETYSCELCGNDSHHGYDCPPRFPLVYEQEPSYNQNFSDNYYPQNSPSFPQQYLCCENCGGPHESFQCQPMNQNHFEHNSNYSNFDQPPQYSINHQPPSIQENLNLQKMYELLQMMQSFCEKLLQQKQAANIDQSPLQEMSIQEMEDLKQHYLDEMLILSNDLQIKDYRNEKIDICFRRECESMIDELKGKFNGLSIEINKKKELQRLEQVANLSAYPSSSVEDLVPIPSESEDTSESDSDCELPSCDDFSPINVYEEKSVTFSNPLFNSNDDFTSSDDESLSDEDVSEDKVKIYSNPLFEFGDEYISSDINPLFDEVLENNESKDSYVSNLDEPALLVTPLSDDNEDECFDLGDDIDEIKACLISNSILLGIDDANFDPEGDILLLKKLLNDDLSSPLPPKELYFEELKLIKSSIDTSQDFEDDYHDSEGDIIYLECLLIDDTIPNLIPEVFLDHDPRSLKDELDKKDLKSVVKVFDPEIYDKKISPTYVSLSFEDRHYLSFTYVIRIFLPYFTYPVESPFLLSSGSEDTIFDSGISAFHFSSLEPVASHRSDCPDFEDSRARGSVHRSLDLLSFACLFMGIRYPRSY
ncbi:hypothetical protein Tco_1111265 [Tanacetum coccineum]|uniref:Uncharacterized protein n=1 Tax=Tanacetum coccineum TaxID=301880 RepID=A0ABQ5IL72_9ASTR